VEHRKYGHVVCSESKHVGMQGQYTGMAVGSESTLHRRGACAWKQQRTVSKMSCSAVQGLPGTHTRLCVEAGGGGRPWGLGLREGVGLGCALNPQIKATRLARGLEGGLRVWG
jgi:hypothetical protein